MRNPLNKRAFRVHLIVFFLVAVALAVADFTQGEAGAAMLLGLHWAPMIVLPWAAVLGFHALLAVWDAVAADTEEVRKRWWI